MEGARVLHESPEDQRATNPTIMGRARLQPTRHDPTPAVILRQRSLRQKPETPNEGSLHKVLSHQNQTEGCPTLSASCALGWEPTLPKRPAAVEK